MRRLGRTRCAQRARSTNRRLTIAFGLATLAGPVAGLVAVPRCGRPTVAAHETGAFAALVPADLPPAAARTPGVAAVPRRRDGARDEAVARTRAIDTTPPLPVPLPGDRPAAAPAEGATTYPADVFSAGNVGLKRWDDRRERPVHVWIAPGGSAPGWRPAYAVVVREAFAAWEAVGVPLRFAFVDRPEDAEVRVEWTEQLSGRRAGVIYRTASGAGWLTRARIVLAMRLSDGALTNDVSVRRVALHEIGHLLGLEHSADPGDIMAAWVGAGDLTERDRASARFLYALPRRDAAGGSRAADAGG